MFSNHGSYGRPSENGYFFLFLVGFLYTNQANKSFEQKKENFAILAIRKPNQCSQHSNKEC